MATVGPTTRARRIEIGPLTPMRREDLAVLAQPREVSVWQPKELRDSHHRIARMLASGMRSKEIAEITGYAHARLSILKNSPAMKDLVAEYRKEVHAAWVNSQQGYQELITQNMVAAERHIADAIDDLDERGELLPIRTALAISRDAADRMGYHKKSTNFNVNADFASMLEAAIKRSGKGADPAGAKLVEAVAANAPAQDAPRASSPPLAPKVPASPVRGIARRV